jgi:hypothetical protein
MTYGTQVRTQVERHKFPPPYDEWQTYKSFLPGRQELCNVGVAGQKEEDEIKPWLTLVLGSGCPTSKDQVDELLRTAAQLEATIWASPEMGVFIDGNPMASVVRHFAEDLIVDRLRLAECPPCDGSAGDVLQHEDKWVADVFVGAALLTKLYFQAKSVSYDAPRRADHRDEVVLSRQSTSWCDLKEQCIDPCHRALRRLVDEAGAIAGRLSPGDVQGARATIRTIQALMNHVAKLLDPGEHEQAIRLGLWDVQSLAEFAWLSLTTITSQNAIVYPGWHDLLLHLSNYDEIDEGRVGMPLFRRMSDAYKFIRTRYEAVTRASCEGSGSQLYRAAAQMLVAEAHFRHEAGVGLGQPPAASAFVTSFDVELELALLREAAAFTVVLPVHVLNAKDRVAHTSWLAVSVPERRRGEDLSRSLEKLKKPDESQISILGLLTKLDGPVVVRLAGCPLIELPPLNSLRSKLAEFFKSRLRNDLAKGLTGDQEAQKLEGITRELRWEPAVVINEHDAILQNELDLLPTGEGAGQDEMGDARRGPAESQTTEKRFGLTPMVTEGETGWARFWMLLGVQISDTAVRHRIATLLSAVNPTWDPHIEINRTGVAVNARISAPEQDLLFWNGFDVVTDEKALDNAELVAKDLQHFTRHLLDGVPLSPGDCSVY